MGDPGEHPTLFCRLSQVIQVQLFVTPWTAACQAPLSMGFSRKEYWSGLSFPSSGDLPDPRIKPGSPAFQADSLLSESPENNLPSPSCSVEVPSLVPN